MALNNAPKKCIGLLLAVLSLSACTTVPVETNEEYSAAERKYLYDQSSWSFEGRLAVSSEKESWSANVAWDHDSVVEKLKLSGPLGQGAVLLTLTNGKVAIDHGNGNIQYSDKPEEIINRELGVFVPVNSLRFWVLGLPEPVNIYQLVGQGFVQSGWLVEFKQMQSIEGKSMPKKIEINKQGVRLKLFVDSWGLNGAESK